MRRKGRRLAWQEVRNGPQYEGELRTHEVVRSDRRYRVATLRADDPVAPALVPDLHEPVLTEVAPLAFGLRGFEVVGESAVVQEWHGELPAK